MADIDVQMEGIIDPTYDKRRKGYKFKKDGMEIFIKGEDKDSAMRQMAELLDKEEEKEPEVSAFAEGGMEDGGLKDEGGSVDPVSGNDVPVGSTQKEVRDDIPAQLSEGEFVLPADVVRYIGLENLMELRNKAKMGLAQMEAMGQMGNADEATMPDTAEMEVDIDAMIDEFDPNDPSTLEFASGGSVQAYNGQFVPPASAVPATQYYQTYGSSNPAAYRVPQIPSVGAGTVMGQTQPSTYQSFIGAPAQAAATRAQQAGTVENREYIGPNGERTTIRFMNGRPIDVIPEGYTEFDPNAASQAQPQIQAPKVERDTGTGPEDQKAQEEAAAEYGGWVNAMETLASVNEEVANAWSKSPHNKNNKNISFNIAANIANDYSLSQIAQDQIPGIANEFGLDIENYTNKFSFFGLDKYDEKALATDINAAKSISESLGVDPKDLARSDLDRNEDGKVTKDDLVDEKGNLTKEGLDLFNIESEDDDPSTSGPTTTGRGGAGRDAGDAGPAAGDPGTSGPSSSSGDGAGRDAGNAGPAAGDPGSGASGGNENDGGAGVDSGTPFAKGGAVEQTKRALKSSRNKK